MKIKKYIKVGKSNYKIILEDNTSLVLHEDVILKFNLLLTKEIDDLKKIKKYQDKYLIYDKVLGFISKKIRSELEVRKYLEKYLDNEEEINKLVNKLYENNLLNNNLYIKSYLNDKLNLTLDGPNKIKNDLINLGFDANLIEDELVIFNKEIIFERINKYLNKHLKSNKNSLYTFKNKMLYNLVNLGYLKEDILSCLNNIRVDEDNLKEKELEKLKKKYSKKYQGFELEMVIKRKLYEKGYRD